jgi:hypothetical protein
LLNSEALVYEVGRIPDELRRTEVFSVLTLAQTQLKITDEVENLALALEQQGIRAMDAVHLALASIAKADFFALVTTSYIGEHKHFWVCHAKSLRFLALYWRSHNEYADSTHVGTH